MREREGGREGGNSPLCGAVLADHTVGVLDVEPLGVVRVTNESKHLHVAMEKHHTEFVSSAVFDL